MQHLQQRLWQEEDGVLSFEWVLLLTLLTIGIVSGLTAARDAIIDELGDLAEAAQGFDQSYSLAGINIPGFLVLPDQQFTEGPEDQVFQDCGRVILTPGDPNKPVNDAVGPN